MPAFLARLSVGRVYLVSAAMLLSILFFAVVPALAQSELATVFGRVTDPSGAVIGGAEVEVRNIDTGISVTSATNADGLYIVPSLHPGDYVISVHKSGFRSVSATGLELNVQDNVARNFSLQVGSAAESVTVSAEAQKIDTTDATISTVIDRNFAENLPMNGRSFQTLIELVPGVVVVPSNGSDPGQFSANGQRSAANYWTIDGVSANVGVPALFTQGNGMGGSIPGLSIQGGTNSLVSVDAMQEFRVQTSTYAPEFGRTPGAQISIVTRAGTNQFHGALFDYLRNDAFDANDWFANHDGLPKPKERQNDFGGVLGGPILKDRTFFFFSYEGLRLRLPEVVESLVPDASFTPGGTSNSRQNAAAAVQPFLNAFPLPNRTSPEILVSCNPATDPSCPSSGQKPTGSAAFNASFSNSSALDAYSLRIDHRIAEKVTTFARYSYAPSELNLRGSVGALSQFAPAILDSQTATAGVSITISPQTVNDFRFNYSRTAGRSDGRLDDFGGAVPLTTLPFPGSFSETGTLAYGISSLNNGFEVGPIGRNTQKQVNITDALTVQHTSHTLKIGVDFRRLSPSFAFPTYQQQVRFLNVASAAAGDLFFSVVSADRPGTLILHNLGTFAQDTWRVRPRLTLTYGARWDIDFSPAAGNGISLNAVTGFDLNDLSQLALAPEGTPAFRTTYGNIAPRIGVAYEISQSPGKQTVLRGGFGTFYDLATSELGNSLHEADYPFGSLRGAFGGTFPLSASAGTPFPITRSELPSSELFAFDPRLKLPYTLQWDIALEQAVGAQQSVSVSYAGAAGRQLMQSGLVSRPNANFGSVQIVTNAATSDYDALQVQFQRHLSAGFQALASYTWAHSIDTASAGSVFGNQANALLPANPKANRGPSDFDVRNAFSAGLTYTIPTAHLTRFITVLLRDWSLQNIVQVRSATPVDLFDSSLFKGFTSSIINVRPDAVPGQAFYLYGREFPGGKAFNPIAFSDPPLDPNTGAPVRQGDLGRNALRSFGAAQWDLAIHREFHLRESVSLQFRAEMFNALNHPNFGPPVADLSNTSQFGQSIQMLGTSLDNSNQGGGSLSPLYQLGGPRSIQFALKLQF